MGMREYDEKKTELLGVVLPIRQPIIGTVL
jgi:hypothetical protein